MNLFQIYVIFVQVVIVIVVVLTITISVDIVSIPYFKLINMIKYKAEMNMIDVVIHEESYTSKCSFIDNEDIKKHDKYLGRRIKRGLFKSNSGLIINADLNGAFNIIRKVVPKFNYNGIEGGAVHPSRISL